MTIAPAAMNVEPRTEPASVRAELGRIPRLLLHANDADSIASITAMNPQAMPIH
jgi:hypothetical protein